MTICTGINASDIPTVDLKLLAADLEKRIRKDMALREEILEELHDRASRDAVLSSRGGKIELHTPDTES